MTTSVPSDPEATQAAPTASAPPVTKPAIPRPRQGAPDQGAADVEAPTIPAGSRRRWLDAVRPRWARSVVGWLRRGLSIARPAAPALAAYVCVRLICLTVLWWWAGSLGMDPLELMASRFDAGWYWDIARNGYDSGIEFGPDGEPVNSNLAFFPLLPALLWLFDAVLPYHDNVVGLVVGGLAGVAAAWGIFAVGNHLRGPRVGVLLAVFWGVLPHAVIETMAYTESLLTALAAWALYAVLTRRWITAGVLCVFAGLTRPTAVALIAAVGLAALVAVVRRRDSWRPWVAALLAPLGWLGFVAWVAARVGSPDGWFRVQEIWGSSFDYGVSTYEAVATLLTRENIRPVYLFVTLILAIGVVLLAMAHRQPLPVWVYSAAMLFIAIGGTGYFHSKARFLLPAFTLLLPVAAGAAKMRLRSLIVTLAFLVCLSAWFGAYLRLVWPYSP